MSIEKVNQVELSEVVQFQIAFEKHLTDFAITLMHLSMELALIENELNSIERKVKNLEEKDS